MIFGLGSANHHRPLGGPPRQRLLSDVQSNDRSALPAFESAFVCAVGWPTVRDDLQWERSLGRQGTAAPTRRIAGAVQATGSACACSRSPWVSQAAVRRRTAGGITGRCWDVEEESWPAIGTAPCVSRPRLKAVNRDGVAAEDDQGHRLPPRWHVGRCRDASTKIATIPEHQQRGAARLR